MEDQEGSVCSVQSGDSVCSDQSTTSVNSFLPAVGARRRRRCPLATETETETDVDSVQSSPKHLKLSPLSELISTLPDFVVHEILTCLPIEEAIKTSVLSREWRPLWKQMPTLCFRHSRFSFDLDKFAHFVDKTLDHFSTGPKVKNFAISFKFTESMASSLDKWVHFATECRVEKLCLVLEGGNANALFVGATPYRLPPFFYKHSYFKCLTLRQCIVSCESYVPWKSLKLLYISHSRFNNETIQTILSGSPKLQKLVLRNCDGISRISSTSLKILTLDGIYDADHKEYCRTEIACPNLQCFSLLGFICRRTCRFLHVSPLSMVNMGFEMKVDKKDKSDSTRHQHIVREMLQKFRDADNLIVGRWCLQVLSICETKGMSSPMSRRSFLELKTEVHEWELPGIMNLLKCSPFLKKLVIDLTPSDISGPDFDEDFNLYEFDEGKILSLTDWIRKSFLGSLENVEIIGYQPHCSRSNGLLVKLLTFFVKNANVLKKVSIYEESGRHHQSWKSSGPNQSIGDAVRNEMVLMLSDSLPENAIINQ